MGQGLISQGAGETFTQGALGAIPKEVLLLKSSQVLRTEESQRLCEQLPIRNKPLVSLLGPSS